MGVRPHSQNIELGKIKSDKPVNFNIDILANKLLENKDILITASSSDITYELFLDRQLEQAGIATSNSKYLLNITFDTNGYEGQIKEYIDVTLSNIRGKEVTFRVNISGQIIPLIESVPNNIFFGNVDSTNTFEKTIQIINGKQESIDIIDVLFPENIKGTYYVVAEDIWKKDITIRINFPFLEKSIGKFIVTIKVRTDNSKIHKLEIPSVYIGTPNMKNQ